MNGIYPLSFPAAWIVATGLLVMLSACKKDKEGEGDGLPVLGTCQSVDLLGRLSLRDDGNYYYESAGGATILIFNKALQGLVITIGYKSYSNFTYQFWGDSNEQGGGTADHENLNGKHIKDRLGKGRSVIFPDGTKITMVSEDWQKPVTAVSIYDGGYAHHLNVTCDKVEYSASAQDIATKLDERQVDGETATFEITDTGLRFYNIYTETTPGNKVEQRVELGELIKESPNLINDFYDDPRIAHT